MIAGEDGPGMSRIMGAGVGMGGAVSFDRLEPADQITYRAPYRAGPSAGVEGGQVEAARAHLMDWLGLDLNQIVLAREGCDSARDRMLGRAGDVRAAA